VRLTSVSRPSYFYTVMTGEARWGR